LCSIDGTLKIIFLKGLLFGYGTGAIANAQDGIAATFTEAGKLTDIESGSLVGSIVLGAMIGSLVGGSIADKIGRRWSMIVRRVHLRVFSMI
jgi:MFS family permease